MTGAESRWCRDESRYFVRHDHVQIRDITYPIKLCKYDRFQSGLPSSDGALLMICFSLCNLTFPAAAHPMI